ncbi:ornithine cyclodeaminase family protein [Microvirga mediterraneensis]|uniref:Ornithine cyclodeaminase family protein n=1 Tax=Microvirga mediterraneensis TaxID=2754695 RepID=A0A838BVZ5_9HYPH|nr:ornithine cyclodeaminase family protein [Microvirga mediterraneensis]MBA1159035.1 ornithine cyclodeaminase family protein [Microvirga mediterraneensis]
MTQPSPAWLDATAVLDRMRRVDAVAAMRELFEAHGRGRVTQPPQVLTLLPDNRGDFITYSGILPEDGVFGVKVSPYVVTPSGGKVTATTVLMSLETGQPLLFCDSLALTTERTAATTALAVDLLAQSNAADLTLIGSGPVALAHLRHVVPLRPWRRIRIHSRNISAKKGVFKLRLGELRPAPEIVDDCSLAVADADVVLLCTSSGIPVLSMDHIRPGMLVTSISTNVAQAHEVPPDALARMNVYCDDRSTTPLIAGEMLLASKNGWSRDDIRGDLGELASGKAQAPSPDRASFFRSMGLGIEDVKMALEILRVSSHAF